MPRRLLCFVSVALVCLTVCGCASKNRKRKDYRDEPVPAPPSANYAEGFYEPGPQPLTIPPHPPRSILSGPKSSDDGLIAPPAPLPPQVPGVSQRRRPGGLLNRLVFGNRNNDHQTASHREPAALSPQVARKLQVQTSTTTREEIEDWPHAK